MKNKTGYILGISRGHNAAVCLLKDGKIVFSIEEERLTRRKYDGAPLAGIVKVLEYTKKVDALVIAHTQPDESRLDYSGDKVYSGLARKLGLISNDDQVHEVHDKHHEMHAACAFYRSGFKEAAALVADGCGSQLFIEEGTRDIWEFESIFGCSYNKPFKPLYKHFGNNGPFTLQRFEQEGCEILIDENPGIVKAYEAVTEYCGWSSIEAGKTMGLFPYGKRKDGLQPLVRNGSVDRSMIIPRVPNGAMVNYNNHEYLNNHDSEDLTLLDNRRDLAYRVQVDSQKAMLNLILKAAKIGKTKNVVVSGGYGLNCVANYYYLDKLKEHDINLFVEPISNDAGTSIGAALWYYYQVQEADNYTGSRERNENLYLGPKYDYSEWDFDGIASAEIQYNQSYSDVIDLLRNKNIVAMFQGSCENGPRALGNRSILFDPTFEDGKDFVNDVKHREYFRPFAGTVLEEHTHDWFDLRGMESSPSMMYAVNCKDIDGKFVGDIIPSVIHVDGSCRIQTVNKEQNEHFYNLISEFYKETGVPVLFNTSFNLAGEPLVETLDDAIKTLVESDIEYLYMPEYELIIHIKN